ncbi:DUF4926 domain-containing protein [Actinosynnema sp. CS-041913]|uniref:DUF4926 domain-containing protein n=1 Tax=Actinosynnema sp. CS-041913 TaxID=3239917 RepID=UPI003D8A162E
MELFEVVELAVDLPEDGLSAGAIGTIVDEYPDSGKYEVEFADDNGRTIALTALRSDQIRPRR